MGKYCEELLHIKKLNDHWRYVNAERKITEKI